MDPRRPGRLAALLVLAALVALVALRLSAFGILDPWELNAADAARNLAEGDGAEAEGPPLGRWVAAVGFALLGTTELAGRLPIALAGLASLLALYFLVARGAGRRAGVYAAIVAATTPLFLLNARQMLGLAPAFLAETMVGLCAASAVFWPVGQRDASVRRRGWATVAWLVGATASAVLAAFASGAMLGVLPPLAAVAIAAGLAGALTSPDARRSAAAWTVAAGATFVALVLVREVAMDAAHYSPWLGGKPRGGEPPAFGSVLESVFHTFAPWSALLLIALGRMLVPGAPPAAGGREPDTDLRRVVVLWAAFGYGALTVYLSRYGMASWTAVAPLAAACALLLRDVERSDEAWWPAAVVATLFVVLLIRDFGLYPGSPLAALPVEALDVPEVFNPRTAWTMAFAAFALTVVLCFGAPQGLTFARAFGPYRRLIERGRSERGVALRLAAGGVVTLGLLIAGLLAWLEPAWLPLTVLTRKVAMGAALLIFPVLPVTVAIAPVAFFLVAKLGRLRTLPVLAAALAAGGYMAHGFLPALSAHYSPRRIYDTYNRMASEAEPLGEYRVGSRGAAYYARGDVRELGSQADLIRFLTEGDGRRWAVMPTEELPAINRRYRKKSGRHLYVADATSGRAILAANRAVSDHPDENFLAKVVLDAPRTVDHPVGANFDGKIELVGYDLELPRRKHVGAGEKFRIRWHWKVLDRISGSWQVFVHIERGPSRLNGDHDPVDGKYPVSLWEVGDVILDEQELTVPAHFAPGDYQIMVGFWIGERRLEVIEGPADDGNRVRAGVLRVR
jgi:hypothetical protein